VDVPVFVGSEDRSILSVFILIVSQISMLSGDDVKSYIGWCGWEGSEG